MNNKQVVSIVEYTDSLGIKVERSDGTEVFLFVDNRLVLMDTGELVDLQVLVWAMANGWTIERIMCYDEEGVEGWRWTTLDGVSEYDVVSPHDEMPDIPDEVRDMFIEWSHQELGLEDVEESNKAYFLDRFNARFGKS